MACLWKTEKKHGAFLKGTDMICHSKLSFLPTNKTDTKSLYQDKQRTLVIIFFDFFSMFPILVVDLSQSTYLILLFNSLLLSYMHCNVFSFHFTTIFLPFFPSFVLLPGRIYILYFLSFHLFISCIIDKLTFDNRPIQL